MDKNNAKNALKRFREALQKKGFSITQMILFGSYANGTQREDSDIDVVVISEGFKNLDYWQRIDVLSKAIYEVFEPIEATAYTSEEWAAADTTIHEYAKNGEFITA
jgi:predicted nucleotidyltransferase